MFIPVLQLQNPKARVKLRNQGEAAPLQPAIVPVPLPNNAGNLLPIAKTAVTQARFASYPIRKHQDLHFPWLFNLHSRLPGPLEETTNQHLHSRLPRYWNYLSCPRKVQIQLRNAKQNQQPDRPQTGPSQPLKALKHQPFSFTRGRKQFSESTSSSKLDFFHLWCQSLKHPRSENESRCIEICLYLCSEPIKVKQQSE